MDRSSSGSPNSSSTGSGTPAAGASRCSSCSLCTSHPSCSRLRSPAAWASDRAVAAIAVAAYFTGVSNTVLRHGCPPTLLFALVLTLLIRDARSPSRWVFAVFPLLVLWTNIHGSVMIGAALVSLRGVTILVGAARSRLPARAWLGRGTGLLVLPWACTLLSPYGLGLIHYYRSTLGNSGLAHASSEWGPTSVKTDPVFFGLLLVAVWLVGRARGATTWFDRLALAGVGLAGLYAVRYTVWFAIAAAAILPPALAEAWRSTDAPRRARLNSALAGLAVAAGAAGAAVVGLHGNGWFERDYPQRRPAPSPRRPRQIRRPGARRREVCGLADVRASRARGARRLRRAVRAPDEHPAREARRLPERVRAALAAGGRRLRRPRPRSARRRRDDRVHRGRPGTKVLFQSRAVVVLAAAAARSATTGCRRSASPVPVLQSTRLGGRGVTS